jgi:hypothetical protein
MTTPQSTMITNPMLDDQQELKLSSVKITKLASGFDQLEIKVYAESVAEAAELARTTWNQLWSSGDFIMPLPKEGTDKGR